MKTVVLDVSIGDIIAGFPKLSLFVYLWNIYIDDN